MGSPRFPTQAQIKELRAGTELPGPEQRKITSGELSFTLPGHGLAVIELK
jgi:hypothetical protein